MRRYMYYIKYYNTLSSSLLKVLRGCRFYGVLNNQIVDNFKENEKITIEKSLNAF